MKLPVAFMAFDRPHYIDQVFQSTRNQINFGGLEPEYFLFLDGGVSPRTGRKYAEQRDLEASAERFRKHFPEGHIIASQTNLGVAMNFDRAERILFLDYGYDAAVFLEDDMVLQPHYFESMAALIAMMLEHDYIGVATCYGFEVNTPLERQRALQNTLCAMNEHNWAFAISKACWTRRDALLRPYLDLIETVDYRDRKDFHPQIHAWQRGLGRHGQGYHTSQDSVKNLACEVLDIHRVCTYTNNARYIGRSGEHMDEDRFYERGYHQTILYPDRHTSFERPSLEALRRQRLVHRGF